MCGLIAQPFVLSSVRDVLIGLPAWGQALVALIAGDFAVYWFHRWSHTVPWLWRFHAVHHSSQALDWIAGARRHPVGNALAAILGVVPLVVLGLDALTVGALGLLTGVTGVFLHANVRWRLRFLDGIWSTPEFHLDPQQRLVFRDRISRLAEGYPLLVGDQGLADQPVT